MLDLPVGTIASRGHLGCWCRGGGDARALRAEAVGTRWRRLTRWQPSGRGILACCSGLQHYHATSGRHRECFDSIPSLSKHLSGQRAPGNLPGHTNDHRSLQGTWRHPYSTGNVAQLSSFSEAREPEHLDTNQSTGVRSPPSLLYIASFSQYLSRPSKR